MFPPSLWKSRNNDGILTFPPVRPRFLPSGVGPGSIAWLPLHFIFDGLLLWCFRCRSRVRRKRQEGLCGSGSELPGDAATPAGDRVDSEEEEGSGGEGECVVQPNTGWRVDSGVSACNGWCLGEDAEQDRAAGGDTA